MTLTVWTLDSASQWRAALASLPSGLVDVYDTPEYHATWAEYEDARATCLCLESDGVRAVYPFFMKRIGEYDTERTYFDVSSAYGYGGPIVSPAQPPAPVAAKINRAIDGWLADNDVVAEFIRCSPYRPTSRFRNARYVQVRTNVEVALDGKDSAWGRLSSSARRNVARARRAGLTAHLDEDLATVEQFSKLYLATAERIGMDAFYRFPRSYFLRTRDLLGRASLIINADVGDETAASCLCLAYGKRLHYHLGCSSAAHLDKRPNDFLFWQMIQAGLERGLRAIELGGGLSNAPDDPLFRFKRKFGANLLPTFIGTRIHNREVYDNLTTQWKQRYPSLVAKRGNLFLRYRFTD